MFCLQIHHVEQTNTKMYCYFESQYVETNTASKLFLCKFMYHFWWGDGKSQNDESPFEFSGTPGPEINSTWRQNVPTWIHPCNYALCNTYRLMHNSRDVSMQGYCVSETIHLGDQGSQKIRTATHRYVQNKQTIICFRLIMDQFFLLFHTCLR